MIGDVVAFPSGQTHLVWRIEAIRGRNIQMQRGPMRVWVLWSHTNSLRSNNELKKEKTPLRRQTRWGFFNRKKNRKDLKGPISTWEKITSRMSPSKQN